MILKAATCKDKHWEGKLKLKLKRLTSPPHAYGAKVPTSSETCKKVCNRNTVTAM